MSLKELKEGKEAIVANVSTGDLELDAFLFSLGCFAGETIRVISHGRHGSVIAIKDGRYSVDNALSGAIKIV